MKGVLIACVLAVALPALSQELTFTVQGGLRNVVGAAVPDGKYGMEISVYAAEDSNDVLYSEAYPGIQVTDGVFSVLVGTKTPLTEAPFLSGQARWLGFAVGGEPEFARVPLSHVIYAVRAQVAAQLACSGCVTSEHLDPALIESFVSSGALHAVASSGEYSDLAGTPDLSGFAKLADLAAVATTGAYEDLSGAPDPNDLPSLSGSNSFDSPNTFAGPVGLSTTPGEGCAVDVGSAGGDVCVDGAPVRVMRLADSDVAMDAFVASGQPVYRTDTQRVYVRAGDVWRQLQFVPECGDGLVEFPEECDLGDGNNADVADTCRTDCTEPACGDGIQDTPEACDNGNDNGSGPDKCRLDCKNPGCGDGIVDTGEVCDGANLGSQSCSSQVAGSTGDLACKPDCKAFDTTACTVPLTEIVVAALNQPQTGNMGGLIGADQLCQTQAAAAGYPQKFQAFLSTSVRSVKDMMPPGSVNLPVVNRNGDAMFSSWSLLTGGTNPKSSNVLYTFSGVQVDNNFCSDADGWTGSNVTGQSNGEDCGAWTSTGLTGTATEYDADEFLRVETGHACSVPLAVVCVSVP